ncbi:hypothetical protein KAZ66_02170 [Candidatus Woesebacteria bacterium]|nr:hypothetical protein [Candidatus Woesebacteria bacterium]
MSSEHSKNYPSYQGELLLPGNTLLLKNVIDSALQQIKPTEFNTSIQHIFTNISGEISLLNSESIWNYVLRSRGVLDRNLAKKLRIVNRQPVFTLGIATGAGVVAGAHAFSRTIDRLEELNHPNYQLFASIHRALESFPQALQDQVDFQERMETILGTLDQEGLFSHILKESHIVFMQEQNAFMDVLRGYGDRFRLDESQVE